MSRCSKREASINHSDAYPPRYALWRWGEAERAYVRGQMEAMELRSECLYIEFRLQASSLPSIPQEFPEDETKSRQNAQRH